MNEKKVVFKLSPDLTDGEHHAIVEDRYAVLSAIKDWMDEFEDQPGESFSVETEEMTPEEIEALPEI